MLSARPVCRALALAFLLPLLGGCFVTSEHPVQRPGEDGRDLKLRGLWVSKEGREFLHVLRPETEDGQAGEAPGFSGLYVVSEDEGNGGRDSWTRMQIISTRVKDHGILSMRPTDGESGDLKDIPGWLIFAYEIRDGRFYLHIIDEDAINEAIEAGKLPGTPKSGSVSDPHITASSKEWVAFLEQADLNDLFKTDDDSFLVDLPAEKIRSLTGEGDEASEGAH